METRKLYKQGKSTVLVIPAKFLKALGWEAQDDIHVILLPNLTMNLSKGETQIELIKAYPQTHKETMEDQNDDH